MSDTKKQKRNNAFKDWIWDAFSPLWTNSKKKKYKEELRQQNKKIERKKRQQFRHNEENQ